MGTLDDRPERGAAATTRDRWPGKRRLRAWAAAALVVLTSLSIVVASVSIWTHNTLFDTDAFIEVVEPVITDPAFTEALSTRVTDEVITALDLETRVGESLDAFDAYLSAALLGAIDPGERLENLIDQANRPSLSVLAPAIAENLETRIAGRIDEFVTSDAFRSTLVDVVEEGHRAAIAVVRGDFAEYPNVYVQDGNVRLNLIPMARSALEQVWDIVDGYIPDVSLPPVLSNRADEAKSELADALGSRLPDDFGQVTLLTDEDFSAVQAVGDRVDRLVVLIVLAAILLLVVTLVVTPNRRRTLMQLAAGAIAAMVLTFLGIRALQNAIGSRITSPDGSGAARALFDELTQSLRGYTEVIVGIAIVVGVAAFLAGRPALAARVGHRRDGTELSGTERLLAAHPDATRSAGLVFVLLGVALVGFTWWTVLLAGLLLAAILLYVGALEKAGDRETAAEEGLYPSGTPS
jgi:hypothetical protein